MHTVYSTPLCTPPCQCGGGCAPACRRPRFCVMPFFMAAHRHAGSFSQLAASLGRSFLPPLTHSAKRRRRRKALLRAGVKPRQPRAVLARLSFQLLRRARLGSARCSPQKNGAAHGQGQVGGRAGGAHAVRRAITVSRSPPAQRSCLRVSQVQRDAHARE